MNYEQRKSLINSTNDGNHINQEPTEYKYCGERLSRACGFCGDPQEDNEAKACNTCLNDQFVKDWMAGK